MSHQCSGTCSGGCRCGLSKLAWFLVIVGGLNWGLVGVGMLIGKDLNVVHMLLGMWPKVEALIYIIVGICTLVSICGCPCKKCKEECADCMVKDPLSGSPEDHKI